MKKYEIPSEDLETLFSEVVEATSIPQWVEIKLLCDNKQKDMVCKPIKLNDLVSALTPENLNFAIVINEVAFDMLNDLQKRIALEECITGICVSESDSVSLTKGDFVTHRGILHKYGFEPVDAMKETMKAAFIKIKEDEDALKAQTGKKRGRKPNSNK